MPTSPFFSFPSFVVAIDNSEVQSMVNKLETIPALGDIYRLASAQTSPVSSAAGDTVGVFNAFWNTIKTEAHDLLKTVSISDPENPTPEEQAQIDGMRPAFYARWQRSKEPVLRFVIEHTNAYLAKENDYFVFDEIDKKSVGDAATMLGAAVYDLLANYYITEAQRYLSQSLREYTLIGRVIDQDDQPRASVKITLSDDLLEDARQFGSTFSNRQGYYRIGFTALDLEGTYGLSAQFSHPELGSEPIPRTLNYDDSEPKTPVISELTFTEVEKSSIEINSLTTGPMTPELTDYLESNNITRLSNIREIGGLKNASISDPAAATDPALLRLDALANLELINPNLEKNQALADLGYTGVSKIANTSRSGFMSDAATALDDDLEAASIHFQAQALHRYAINQHASTHTLAPGLVGDVPAEHGPSCGCADCESAVSPLAYLADLLLFATTRVEYEESGIDVQFLEERLLQKFSDLPASCTSLDQLICQNRIAAEVLRQYLEDHPPGTEASVALTTATRRYLTDAYRLLLIAIGTNYEQLRAIQHGSEEDRSRLRERLGIQGSNVLEALFIDLADPPNNETFEAALEDLFALRDSNRSTLVPTPESKLEIWSKEHLRAQWRTQDQIDTPYHNGTEAIVDPDIVTVDDYRVPSDANAAFAVWQRRREWIDGLFDLSEQVFLVDRIDHVAGENTIILFGENDPDWIDVDDEFEYADAPEEPTFTATYKAISVEVAGSDLVIQVHQALGVDRGGGTITFGSRTHTNTATRSYSAPSLPDLLEVMAVGSTYPSNPSSVLIKPPSEWEWEEDRGWAEILNELITLAPNVRRGSSAAVSALFDGYGLLPTELLGIVDFLKIYKGFPVLGLHADNDRSPEDWAGFRDILIAVMKRAARTTWLAEEAHEEVTLDPRDFVASMREPKVGPWPPVRTSGVPTLEPDLVSVTELPEVTALHHQPYGPAGLTSLVRVQQRTAAMRLVRQGVQTAHTGGTDMPSLLDHVYGSLALVDGAYAYWMLKLNELGSATSSTAAIADIRDVLLLSLEEFQFVVALDGIGPHSERALERMYAILTRVKKRIDSYPTWFEEDKDVAYWKMSKACLPKWRSSIEVRKAWLAALAEHRDRPIIDADLIGPGDLKRHNTGFRPYELWKARYLQMHSGGGWLNSISDAFSTVSHSSTFDTFTKNQLGHVELGLHILKAEGDKGQDIRPRIAQLDLTATEFNFLTTCRDAISGLTAEERTDVIRIIAQVRKRRHFYLFRTEERDLLVDHSPEYFKLSKPPIGTFPPQPEYPLIPWLALDQDRMIWQRKLEARIGQQAQVLRTLKDKVAEVDGDMILHLRDALIKATGRSARELGDELLIPLENTCCYQTNRVAQAIETLQQLLWRLRTGDLPEPFELITLTAEDFDGAWTWMGSYANWRAAMFVFLYPENVLLPSLRKEQTPAFQEVVENTRNNRRFAPVDACQAAKDFQSYLQDISTLDVKCAAEADVYYRETGCNDQESSPRRLHFIFAQSRSSQRAYYSLIDPGKKEAPTQHTSWLSIPVLAVNARIFGCAIYHPDPQKFIYLFFRKEGSDHRDKFYALRYNLLDALWEEEPLEFQVKKDDLSIAAPSVITSQGFFQADHFSVEIVAIAVRQVDLAIDPTIAITLRKHAGAAQGNYTFYWTMYPGGKEFKPRWGGDGWRISLDNQRVLKGEIRSFTGVVINENAHKIDHHLMVLHNSEATYAGLWSWDYWNIQLTNLLAAQDFFDRTPTANFRGYLEFGQYGTGPFWRIVTRAEIEDLITLHRSSEPVLIKEDSDYVAYVQIFGNPNYLDTVHILSLSEQNENVALRITSPLLRINDRTVAYQVERHGAVLPLIITCHPFTGLPLTHRLGGPGDLLGANVTCIHPISANESTDVDETGRWTIHQDSTSTSGDPIIRFCRTTVTYNAANPAQSTIGHQLAGLPLTPHLDSTPQIQREFTEAELAARKVLSKIHLEQNTNANPRVNDLLLEAYYLVPMQIAGQLTANGHYLAALDWYRTVYDRNAPLDERKIWHGLVQEEVDDPPAERVADWYVDPLNPHAIAATRPHVYTRYTMLSIAQCLFAYADAEYTMDNSESVPRARELYEQALELVQLLNPAPPCPLGAAIQDLSAYVETTPWYWTLHEILEELQPLSGAAELSTTIEDITDVMDGPGELDAKVNAVRIIVDNALANITHPTFNEQLIDYAPRVNAMAEAAMGRNGTARTLEVVAERAFSSFTRTMEQVTGKKITELGSTSLPWLKQRGPALSGGYGTYIDVIRDGRTEAVNTFSAQDPGASFLINSPFPDIWISGMPFQFCVVPNPIVEALIMKAEVELFKIGNCMNIAGMVRELAPFAAPTDSTSGMPAIGVGGNLSLPSLSAIPPSQYRYRAIVDRAKQLVAMAQQVESAFLSTLEKLDAERYSRLRAEQDIETSKANIKLQDLKITEAKSGERLAELQKERATIQVNGLQGMINDGLLTSEALMIANYTALGMLQALAAWAHVKRAITEDGKVSLTAGGGVTAGVSIASAFAADVLLSASRLAATAIDVSIVGLNTANSLASIYASFERRKQEWEFQKTLAQQDVKIGDQQIKLAQDRVRIVGQEREIAGIQHTHAQATLDFLKNKFTNAELYEWMSRILEDVYSWFLQEATSMALLAQRQLAFERQVDLPPFVRTDYWVVDANSIGTASLTGENATDRRGLTGSARLLKDLTELDQYAFSSNSPKLQMAKTLSLGEVAPEELLNLRNTGIARFLTTHDHFDRDYPGHYLRLIKKVSVTVIALNPPSKGIRATLTNGGISRVITGGTIFQERTINRQPEQIALSGGVSDHGVFQLQGEGEFLVPFEGTGVDTSWEFRMEKAANPFDFASIADVLFTIEYEALNSFTHRSNVVARLNQEPARATLALSLKNNLPDQWFDLHNPTQTDTPYAASFRINTGDLVPNMGGQPKMANVMVYVVMKDGARFTHDLVLRGQEVSFVDGLALLPQLAGEPPTGEWSMQFSADEGLDNNAFDAGTVEDVLLVISYSGDTIPYSA